jgi:cyanophycin synthetase
MEIVEIRDLDGPNLFLLRPAIKLEVDLGEGAVDVAEASAQAFILGEGPINGGLTQVGSDRLLSLLVEVVNVLHDRSGIERPETTTRAMEAKGHHVVAFSWRHRSLAKSIARTAFDIVSGRPIDIEAALNSLESLANSAPGADQLPEMLSDIDHSIPVVGITGTNGKTTTTRLLSWILMHAGKRVAWTSSSGVFVQGECVLPGDFTGPAGAARVFEEPNLDIGVLETARGGILLRGLGYESNDVSVVTNISEDHLGLHGVYTVEELARVKQVVVAVTRSEGFVVLNAGDPLVLGMRDGIQGRPFLISRTSDQPEVNSWRSQGGWALWVSNGQVHFSHDGVDEVLTSLNDIPIAFGGKAVHMLENALCAGAAALALGLGVDQVASGLASFRSEVSQNRGRLNVFEAKGATVIVDFAHNAAGLRHLLHLGRGLTGAGNQLIAVIGSAGDRPDDALRELGRIAAEQADVVIGKDTVKYLRGRSPGEIPALLTAGALEGGRESIPVYPSEFEAFSAALTDVKPGETITVMCIEEVDRILDLLEAIGKPIS